MDCNIKTEISQQLLSTLTQIILLDGLFTDYFHRGNNSSTDEIFMSSWNKVKSAKQHLASINLEGDNV